jgi:hypothetical protein
MHATQLTPDAAAIARTIGKELKNARIDSGYTKRRQFVAKSELKNKITPEGVRKIEEGERIPKLENIRMLCSALSLPKKKEKELENLALKASVSRVVRRAGNAKVTFRIEGVPVQIQRLPPKKKAEEFARDVVSDIIPFLNVLGVEIPEDIENFRRVARKAILDRLVA